MTYLPDESDDTSDYKPLDIIRLKSLRHFMNIHSLPLSEGEDSGDPQTLNDE